MARLQPRFRDATPEDSLSIAALSVQVFLDTYATDGIRPDLAREAFSNYSVQAFVGRFAEPDRRFIVSEHQTGLLGFAEMILAPAPAPTGHVIGAELVRLYVQPQCHGMGIGRRLLQRAESMAADQGLPHIWLTAWDGNQRACGFYKAVGYADVGASIYTSEGNSYGNRVFVKQLPAVANTA
ncbi:GNAT family N-acetyltransferase [soil metagenome]